MQATPAVRRRRIALRYFLILLLCRIPYWIWLYPCCLYGDTNSSIEQYMGFPDLSVRLATDDPSVRFCDHIPFFQTLLYGWTFDLGNFIGNQGLAFFGFVVLQSAGYAFVIGRLLHYARRRGCPRSVCGTVLAVYALWPVYSVWITAVVKDSLFSLFTLALTGLLMAVAATEGRIFGSRRFNGWLTLTLCLFMLSKNQCFYITVLVFVWTAIRYGRRHPRTFIPFAAALFFYRIVWLGLVLPACNVAPVGKQELRGTLFQQTARYVMEHPADVSPEERAAIDGVLPYDSLAYYYNPELQDPVKFHYRRQADDAHYAAYYKTWAAQGLRHPMSYLRAVTDCCDAYFYPSARYPICYPSFVTNNAEFPGLYAMEPLVPRTRSGFSRVLGVPVLSLFFDMGFMNWIFIGLLVFLFLRRDTRSLYVCFPGILSLLILLVSPMNGCFRYVMPIIWALPIYLIIPIIHNKNKPCTTIHSAQRMV